MRSVVSDKSILVQFFEENACSEGAEIKQGSKHWSRSTGRFKLRVFRRWHSTGHTFKSTGKEPTKWCRKTASTSYVIQERGLCYSTEEETGKRYELSCDFSHVAAHFTPSVITRRVVEPREVSFQSFICFISFNHDSVFQLSCLSELLQVCNFNSREGKELLRQLGQSYRDTAGGATFKFEKLELVFNDQLSREVNTQSSIPSNNRNMLWKHI